MDQTGGLDWWTELVDQTGGLYWWTGLVDQTGGLDWWTGLVDQTGGLDQWTGLVDWTSGLDQWTRLVDQTGGQWTGPVVKIIFMLCNENSPVRLHLKTATFLHRLQQEYLITRTGPVDWTGGQDWTGGLPPVQSTSPVHRSSPPQCSVVKAQVYKSFIQLQMSYVASNQQSRVARLAGRL